MNTRITKVETALMMPLVANESEPSLPHLMQQAQKMRDQAFGAKVRGFFARIGDFARRQRAMAELRELTDRELADIGLTRGEIAYVFDRPAQPAVTAPAAQVMTLPKATNDRAQGRLAA
ncbi:DUF1127 domain-containing protein [Roseomonas sp. OT10]|uniref:DUF1127 domain-containing protein n=1 Tax=Roseomonas cutis TaxID=2897332 RepID=UPI001E3DE073|nr:DUF1127 domain-containing protein [Roseomonas sp. OT10]UFN49567.1 DUF1127 domain-containing protein [Roseomonas sp. OT10]